MIITNHEQGWDSKVNFTDSKDVFVGYDTYASCCEHAGWFISESSETNYECSANYEDREQESKALVDGYKFDTSFFHELDGDNLEDGGQVCFKLVKDGEKDLFLHLFNSHNGYYNHGFEAKVGGEVWKQGCI